MFNFDTTRFALESLLGDVRFAGMAWATILAIAFCSIDFAGLSRLFTPEQGRDEPKEIWYLTGAWLLGASMNAVMTWWAVSVTLLNNNLGNEVMSRADLIKIVPIFVAVLVWLTRILFIGAISVAGEGLIHSRSSSSRSTRKATPTSTRGSRPKPATAPIRAQSSSSRTYAEPLNLSAPKPAQVTNPGRIRQRPPRPINGRASGTRANGIQASSRNIR
jgi:hypothetical protein